MVDEQVLRGHDVLRLALALAVVATAFVPSAAVAQSGDIPVLVVDLVGDRADANAIADRIERTSGFTVEPDTYHPVAPTTTTAPGAPEVARLFESGVSPSAVGAAMQALGVRVSVIIKSSRQAQIWVREEGSRFARIESAAPATDAPYVARQVAALLPLLRTKPEQFPLLREGDA